MTDADLARWGGLLMGLWEALWAPAMAGWTVWQVVVSGLCVGVLIGLLGVPRG